MINARPPALADLLMRRLGSDPGDGSALADVPCLAELQQCRLFAAEHLDEVPAWGDALLGHRRGAEPRQSDDGDITNKKYGWQALVSQAAEQKASDLHMAGLDRDGKSRLRSCRGGRSGCWLVAPLSMNPWSFQTRWCSVCFVAG